MESNMTFYKRQSSGRERKIMEKSKKKKHSQKNVWIVCKSFCVCAHICVCEWCACVCVCVFV